MTAAALILQAASIIIAYVLVYRLTLRQQDIERRLDELEDTFKRRP